MRILELNQQKEIEKVMRDIKVDPYGIKIMAPKAKHYLIKINSLANVAANILKQEMLSLGADVAIAKDSLTGKTKRTDCLAIASLAQLSNLNKKLSRQPFGLDKLSQQISSLINNYQKNNFTLDLGKYKLTLKNGKAMIMAIINVTPDSFSGDGLYEAGMEKIVAYAEELVKEGADILDVGGESSKPGARPVSLKEELARTIPVIQALAKKIKVPISIDTSKPEVAKCALENGACMINDITGLKNPKMIKIARKYGCAVVIMHMKGTPANMQDNPEYSFLLDEITDFLSKAIDTALQGGIKKEKIIIDPGIGFGKTIEHNLEILKNLKELKSLGVPIMVGTSRKSFIGKILNKEPGDRIFGTIATSVLAVQNGANILRVHDVKEVKQSIKILNRLNNL